MHKTRQTYYFNSAKPSHLLAMKLWMDEHFAYIFCIKDNNGIIQSDPKKVNASFASFYQELYNSESNFNKYICNNFLDDTKLPRLSNDDSIKLVIDGTQSLSSPAAVLSLDAMKAFDRLE